jgi:hypothetical protein
MKQNSIKKRAMSKTHLQGKVSSPERGSYPVKLFHEGKMKA